MADRKKRPKRSTPANAEYRVVLVRRGADGREQQEAEFGEFQRHAKGEATRKCEAFGMDAVVEAILAGAPYRLIAETIGVSFGAFFLWINADTDRSARARKARADAAQTYDEMAEAALMTAASTAVEIQRAAQLASHYRWRAKVVNPADYGDKQQHEHEHKLSVVDALRQLDQRRAQQSTQTERQHEEA